MKKYKIGILVDQLVPGGVQKSAIQEAQYLKKLGHDVRLFVLVKLDISYQYQDLSTGLEVIYLSDFNPWPFKRAWRIPYFSFLTTLHLLNPFFAGRYQILKNLDFIVSHGTTTCITARAVSLRLKIPYLAFIWDPMLYIWEKVYGSSPIRWLSPFIKSLIKKYKGPTPRALVESAVNWIKFFESQKFTNLVISIKSSDPETTVKANEILFASMKKRKKLWIHLK